MNLLSETLFVPADASSSSNFERERDPAMCRSLSLMLSTTVGMISPLYLSIEKRETGREDEREIGNVYTIVIAMFFFRYTTTSDDVVGGCSSRNPPSLSCNPNRLVSL